MNPSQSPLPIEPHLNFYQQRITAREQSIAALKQKDRRLSWVRLLAFLVSISLLIAWANGLGSWLALLSLITFFGFVAVVAWHVQLQEKLNRDTQDRDLAERQLLRIRRAFAELPASTQQPSLPQPSKERTSPGDVANQQSTTSAHLSLDDFVVADLDLFGEASLWQLVSRTSTPLGEATLCNWLRNPCGAEEVRLRQEAIQALAARPESCHEVALSGSLLMSSRGNTTQEFLDWAESGGWLRHRTGLLWIQRALALSVCILLVGVLSQWLAVGWALVVLLVIVINISVNMVWIGKVHDTFNQISAGKFDLQYYIELFRAVSDLPERPAMLGGLKSKMQIGEVHFEQALSSFWRILRWTNGRKSGVFAIFWLFAQILFFWDFHVLLWLELWQRKFGSQVRSWFEAVAELESLASLATLSHDHPNWTFPLVDSSTTEFAATGLGHPLLPAVDCVRNDVKLGPSGSFLLVTGSNMSGKSTLLRAVGVNGVLALAGGPVCAESLCLPPVVLATSMRITDSLNTGVSFFMAELKRVKAIVDRARVLDENDKFPMLYLLDEILQGTNSAERHVAVVRILKYLLRTHAIGAISTHDLDLANASELQGKAQLVHLRETIEQTPEGEQMRFDYVLRPGVTPTTNALRLLEMVGLSEN